MPTVGAWLLFLGAPSLATAHANPLPTAPHKTLSVGSLQLHRCRDVVAYCASLDRPMDPTGAIPGRISIHFEFFPHSGASKALGTLVATEGGPGYPATLSRDAYLSLFEPLRQDRDVLIMDNRGTGQSGAIVCRELQAAERWTVELIGACGDSLGATAPLYGTAYATDDLAAILDALEIRRIDLYGDSYGTYFEQVFALRHPGTLHSIVLDGAYPLNGPDYPWYPTYAPAMRDKFDVACRRFGPCANLPGASIDHIVPALELLRAHPVEAQGRDGDGAQKSFTANAAMLATVMFANAPAFATTRETDAAARAFVAGDRLPLLRLMAETTTGVDSRDPDADPTHWSAGLSAAAMCEQTPQIFDMRLPPALRRADRDRLLTERRRLHPDTYAPFTIDEFRGMPLDYSFLDQCVGWPAAPASAPAVTAGMKYPDIPALVISGELDNITTPADGAAVAAAFKRGVQVRIANSFHVNALPHARSPCAAAIVRRFFATLTPGDTSCAARVPPLRLVSQFALQSGQLTPVAAQAGNRADDAHRRFAAAALATLSDVLSRPVGDGRGVGLRGGAFTASAHGSATHFELDQVKWTQDLSVSGTIDRASRSGGKVHARLRLKTPVGGSGEITVDWNDSGTAPIAHVRGSVDGATLIAQAPAP